jgi:hypothetical protein
VEKRKRKKERREGRGGVKPDAAVYLLHDLLIFRVKVGECSLAGEIARLLVVRPKPLPVKQLRQPLHANGMLMST